ncbi:MAG: shikimate dehydrogenase [Gammaproteobacteria bacterium]|nr:shikimate dehydrogenase [Gammaproteobacteria bacterium]
MGNPIAHSKSPQIHAAFAKQTGQNIDYQAILVEPGALDQSIGNFQANGGKGLNITVPFKQDVLELADKLSERARLAGAVNTLRFEADGTLFGDNTDGAGLVRDLVHNHGRRLTDKEILILGAGGAARGVLEPLLQENPDSLVIANRTVDRATTLADEFKHLGHISACGFDKIDGRRFDLVINATSASLHGELPPLPDSLLAEGGWVYDMMYGAEPTIFMRWGETHGADKALDGLGMLVEQAAESFNIWRGVRPQTQAVIDELRQAMKTS